MEKQWIFPHGENLTKDGHNNSSIETFLDNIGMSLTREVIQNSLDAKDINSSEPVHVKFNEFNFKTEEIPGIDQVKNFALPRAKEMWRDYDETYEFLLDYEKVIDSEELTILQISDYNTTGLNKENFESLIDGNNFSTKNSIDSAGSKGIGKAAPFAASELRMVFYNSNSIQNGIKSTGVLNFVSFPYSDENPNIITQVRSIFKNSDDSYFTEQLTFNQQERKDLEYGTDIFLIGLKQLGDWKEKIKLAVLNNFLVSLFNNELVVEIYGDYISHENLSDSIKSIEIENLTADQKREFKNTTNYYKVLTDPNHVKVNFPDSLVEKYGFINKADDAVLYLLDIDSANRKVLQTRKAGMKIFERSHIHGVINFSGVFQATGTELNKFLKDLENANHDKWSSDRKTGKEKRLADDFLRDLLHWYKSEVEENYGTASDDVTDAIGVVDLLPIIENTEGKLKPDSGIQQKFEPVKLKENSKTPNTTDADKEGELLEKQIKELGVVDSENGEFNPGDPEPESDNEGDKRDLIYKPDKQGNKHIVSDSDSEKIKAEQKTRVDEGNLSLKLIGIDYSKGKYKIVGKSSKDIGKLILELKAVGDNGSTYKLNILNSFSYKQSIEFSRKEIIIPNLSKNDDIAIDFEIDNHLRLKMEVTAYEIKK